MTVEEVAELSKKGCNPQTYLEKNPELRAVMEWVGLNYFTPDEPPGVLTMLRDNLCYSDPFSLVCRTSSLTAIARKEWTPPFATNRAGRKRATQTRHEWGNSQATAPLRNTRAISGRSNRSLFDGRVVFLLAARMRIGAGNSSFPENENAVRAKRSETDEPILPLSRRIRILQQHGRLSPRARRGAIQNESRAIALRCRPTRLKYKLLLRQQSIRWRPASHF